MYFAVTILVCLLASRASALDTLVDLSYAQYDGTALPNGVTQWLGMRYASPPVDQLRFAPPHDPEKVEGVQAADSHGPICLSVGGDPNSDKESEDCLFIEVFAPSNATKDKPLPVYFFIQGGGFASNSNPNLNGSNLIAASDYNIITVTSNYRVGPYGFLSGPEVLSASDAAVNNGLRDQVKALQWVQQHISAFGGDPRQVTIGGASAGAGSVVHHLTAYGGRDDGLFHAAAAESQSFPVVLTVNESEYQLINLANKLNCTATNRFACLRNASTASIQKHSKAIPFPIPNNTRPPLYMWAPVIDEDLIPDQPFLLLQQGKFIHVPAIFGTDTNEGTTFVPRNTTTRTGQDTFLRAQFPNITAEQLDKLDSMYTNPNQTCPNTGCLWRKTSDIYGDLRYGCPGVYASAKYAAAGLASYNYRYNVQDPEQVSEGLGVPHTVEVNAIWGDGGVQGDIPESYEKAGKNEWIVRWMMGYWTSFVRSADPNSFRVEGSVEWEGIGSGEEYKRILLDTEEMSAMEKVEGLQREKCEYIWSIIPWTTDFPELEH